MGSTNQVFILPGLLHAVGDRFSPSLLSRWEAGSSAPNLAWFSF
jgi:hypothetical protein